ncbi:hypothetical protein SAMN05421504_11710 [Amycolatopsis xylanica]|uniref:Integrase n=1 Tax=Amycolatopsis xylanica TaxID=589385 RepID=A0A1H3T1L5_9PSEU|nr:hypothetical protein SAMN05421504_11710 [Amycolatopsis xylanica]
MSARLSSDPYAGHVLARLLDFFQDTTPWPRGLWEVGSVLALEEAAECGDWVRMKVLSQASVAWYLHDLERRLGPDRGLGDTKLRKELTGLLRSKLPPDGRDRRRLVQLLPAIKRGYLSRWTESVDSACPPSPERLARALATHLLDSGHSSGRLNRWVRRLRACSDATLGDLLEAACGFAEQQDETFEVLVPFLALPGYQGLASHLPEWLSPQRAAEWFTNRGITDPPRHNGAFVYEFTVKDTLAAAREAGALVRRLDGRRSYARSGRKRLTPVGRVWIDGHQGSLPLGSVDRGVSVLSLVNEKSMYSIRQSDRLDEALELAAPLNTGSAATAVAGGWAAIESLLFHPGDQSDVEEGRAVVADRLAAIVACSWPRAELTTLSHRHKPAEPDDLVTRLGECGCQADRVRVIADALLTGAPLALSSPHEVAAAKRMREVLRDPHRQLGCVRTALRGVFRRLYRQRNIVVHGGSTAAIALEPALRTSAPLIGAGLDRLVHSQLIDGLAPLDLAARAENSLALVGDPLGPDPTSLLT